MGEARELVIAGAVEHVRARIGIVPRVGVILGSGLGGFARAVEDAVRVPYAEIPGFPEVSVAGHAGVLTAGRVGGVACAVMQGRFHRYEGYDAAMTALPPRMLIRLGIDTLIVTNAAGGITRTLRPGDLMLIDDHINLTGANPLIGPVLDGEVRFPDMSEPWDRGLQRIAESVAAREGIRLGRGVYCGLPGPSYETPAEVRMLERLGADAVGMSTIPEVLVARASGVRVLGVSLISNPAAGHAAAPLTHEEVLAAGEAASTSLRRLLCGVLEVLASGA